ncbi:MAG: L,D-transpeptidase [SAR86 cluster bacterium]|jgi:lipoprotein-anchoring transpeptidase ErfK/SrfK|nr:MAG: L,D-transpeptidase [SAR86 cluster bacterium]URQ69640.1 L,D-transpeptidase [SAR86 cluster bacterium]|tara:strand:+ start:3110 stop:3688 length:579 start_codon:yes stop_codon:yes gene_type:complete
MQKSLLKTTILLLILVSPRDYTNANDQIEKPELKIKILVDISEQRLYLKSGEQTLVSYPISTSKYGEGSKENSFKTPLGNHIIKEKIGENAPINTIFISRINTKNIASIENKPKNTENDYVTSRIMWLEGEENGVNKGPGIDSYERYIYIHGTHEEGLIGVKASHGCIRMFNVDVIDLYDRIYNGTKVIIRA